MCCRGFVVFYAFDTEQFAKTSSDFWILCIIDDGVDAGVPGGGYHGNHVEVLNVES